MSGTEATAQQEEEEEEEETVIEIEVVQDEEVIGAESDKQEENCDKKGKRSSKAWEYFDELKGCAVGFEKSKCKFCGVIIGCNTNRNGTYAMMNHLKTVCAKSPLRTNLDKLQKTLKFEKLSKDDKFQTLQAHTFDQEKLRKKLALMCIKDNQPFRIVEHEVKYKGAFIRMITEDSNYEPFFKGADLGVSSDNAKKKKKKFVEVFYTA
ncbi:hypothetical protein POM88_041092 [Heracleum sosnowskyi]|uniref:BED-type domain-containing protein n=1 Tax=Heracleum sosnowskyi TaxID=360622 RepID=A0AAD8HFD9_9APIA|nr:hypothetical protein POM88_041092 [Heracleum sosnowskyi]